MKPMGRSRPLQPLQDLVVIRKTKGKADRFALVVLGEDGQVRVDNREELLASSSTSSMLGGTISGHSSGIERAMSFWTRSSSSRTFDAGRADRIFVPFHQELYAPFETGGHRFVQVIVEG